MNLFPDSLRVMKTAMDMQMEQQRVTASNLANIDTPGFTARKMDFDASLAKALAGQANPLVIEASEDAPSLDGNNVDLESELATMERTKYMYTLTAQLSAARMRQIGTIFDKEPA